MILTNERLLTVEEYFEIEKTSETRHEFYFGKLIDMPGESKNANRIAKKVESAFDAIIDHKLFETFRGEVRLNINQTAIYRYPDVMIALISDDEDDYAVTQPIVVVEVLSDSTAKVDTGKKLREYTSLASLQYYLVISQDEILVQVNQRKGSFWEFGFYDKLTDKIQLPIFNNHILLKDIYSGIVF
ncbi:MAG: Uma2 family endonuclease [Arcicella sp.]|nr:Uma2 family endonuclease [Arcicella sp.]